MSKTCAFLGNDYDFMRGRRRERRPNLKLREKIKTQVISLIENEDVSNFLVGEIGGFEDDAYDAVLEVKELYPQIRIYLVLSKMSEMQALTWSKDGQEVRKRPFDEFIYPDQCAIGCQRYSIVYRNKYIVENTDFIIAYNEYHGRAYKYCQQAQRKGVKVIELAEV